MGELGTGEETAGVGSAAGEGRSGEVGGQRAEEDVAGGMARDV